MSSERDDSAANRAIVATMVVAILSLIMLLCMGCKTQYIPVTEYKERVVHDTIVKIDSVQVADSVIDRQRERQNGDTTIIEREVERWRTRWRTRTEIQTIEVHHIDSIPYAVEVVREVPRERSGYDKFTSWFTWIAIAAILLYIILRVLVRLGRLNLP